MTTYAALQSSDLVQSAAPMLADAAGQVADAQVRNMGTIGGSLSHADPAGDLPAVAIALNAELVTSSTGDHRRISIDDFFVDLLTTALEPNEILNEISIPALPAGSGSAYAKFGNKASHYAIVGVAAVVSVDGSGNCSGASIGVTGAGPTAVRAIGRGSRASGQQPRRCGNRRGGERSRQRHRVQRGCACIGGVPSAPDIGVRRTRYSRGYC